MKHRTRFAFMWGWALATALSPVGCFEDARTDWPSDRYGPADTRRYSASIQWTGAESEQTPQIDVASFGALTAVGDTATDPYLDLSHPASRQLFVGTGPITPAPDFTSESAGFAPVGRVLWKNFSLADSFRKSSTDADKGN